MAGAIVEGYREQRELAFVVVPVGGCAELHIAGTVAHNRERRGVAAFDEDLGAAFIRELELLGFGCHVLLIGAVVQANRIGKAAIRYQVKIIGYGCGVLTRNLKDLEVLFRGDLLRDIRVVL